MSDEPKCKIRKVSATAVPLCSMLVELADSIERLLEIVEGVRGVRWTDYRGRSLVDTPEWCEFCVVHKKCKDETPNR